MPKDEWVSQNNINYMHQVQSQTCMCRSDRLTDMYVKYLARNYAKEKEN